MMNEEELRQREESLKEKALDESRKAKVVDDLVNHQAKKVVRARGGSLSGAQPIVTQPAARTPFPSKAKKPESKTMEDAPVRSNNAVRTNSDAIRTSSTDDAPSQKRKFVGPQLLSDPDKQALIVYAQLLSDGPLDEEWATQVNGYAKQYNDLGEAKKALRLWNEDHKTRFEGIKKIKQNWPNALDTWLVTEAPLLTCVATAGMTAEIKATGSSTKYILVTQSVMGCLGVAAYGSGCAFLAHWTPDQLKVELCEERIKSIVTIVGPNAVVYLSSPAMNAGATYILNFKNALNLCDLSLGGEYNSQRLAINVKTGDIMIDFSVEGLLED